MKDQQAKPLCSDLEAVEKFRSVPSNWSIDHDEDLAQFLCAHTDADNENLGSVKNYVESISVSTFSVSIVWWILAFLLQRGFFKFYSLLWLITYF